MKILIVKATGCVIIGSLMMTGSYHQTVTTELVSPYSTQSAIFAREIPQPWQFLLRFGGGAIALFGGTYFINQFFRELQPKLDSIQLALSPSRRQYDEEDYEDDDDESPIKPSVKTSVKQPIEQPIERPTERTERSTPIVERTQQFDFRYEEPVNEYDDVKSLVDQGAIQFIGGKGSGKTEKICWLMSEHLKLGHQVWFINPFAPGIHYQGLKVFGRELNYREAAVGIRLFVDEAKKRIVDRAKPRPQYVDPFDCQHIHIALDEISNYGRHISASDETLMTDFWEICIQFLRQINMSVSLAGHGDTQAMSGGEKALKGKSMAIRRDIIRVYCQWKTDTSVKGNKRCAGWAQLVWFDGEEEISKRIEIPDWMRSPNPDFDFSALSQNVVDDLAAEFTKYRLPDE